MVILDGGWERHCRCGLPAKNETQSKAVLGINHTKVDKRNEKKTTGLPWTSLLQRSKLYYHIIGREGHWVGASGNRSNGKLKRKAEAEKLKAETEKKAENWKWWLEFK